MNDVINEVSININLNHYNYVIFTGGGSIVIQDIIKESLPSQCLVATDALKHEYTRSIRSEKVYGNRYFIWQNQKE